MGPQLSHQQQQQQRALQQRQEQHQLFLKNKQQHLQQQQQQQPPQPPAAAVAAEDGGPANRTTPGRYRLHGVLVHQGSSLHFGHYFAYVRTGKMLDRWFKLDDAIRTQVSEQEAMQQVGEG